MENKKIHEDVQSLFSEIPVIKKTESAAFLQTRYKYSPYSEIYSKLLPILKKYNCFISNKIKDSTIITQLFHKDSQEPVLFSEMPMPSFALSQTKDFPKTFGSILSYFKKYNVMLLMNLATEEDEIPEKENLNWEVRSQETQKKVEPQEQKKPFQINQAYVENLLESLSKKSGKPYSEMQDRIIKKMQVATGNSKIESLEVCLKNLDYKKHLEEILKKVRV